ncbi:DUF192 domain-containing protein [Devosia algicola]|uniref:DUF192 domain-containing protein n=1 Tax=Devosia algicola TaxID=3026418 RepID=A0ABY7YQR5_9HYPH|nr:DUF192 domain-containing protein [Devosia algicola]WDR03668.1 DUF192 domain-containing protein [Devosia algicola]
MRVVAQGLAGIANASRVLALILTIFVASTVAGCASSGDEKLTLHTAKGDFAFRVEVVDTPKSRADGLMFRQELASDAGMLFDFKEERPVSFWMRNTFIPLDMIFVDAEGIVKTIHVNARPQDPTSIPSGVPVQFVLEIPGGRSVEIGLKAGDRMDHVRTSGGQGG